jgi:hypothetical protein
MLHRTSLCVFWHIHYTSNVTSDRSSKPGRKGGAPSSPSAKQARIVLELPESRKRAIKVAAAAAGLTMKEYLLKLLDQAGL